MMEDFDVNSYLDEYEAKRKKDDDFFCTDEANIVEEEAE